MSPVRNRVSAISKLFCIFFVKPNIATLGDDQLQSPWRSWQSENFCRSKVPLKQLKAQTWVESFQFFYNLLTLFHIAVEIFPVKLCFCFQGVHKLDQVVENFLEFRFNTSQFVIGSSSRYESFDLIRSDTEDLGYCDQKPCNDFLNFSRTELNIRADAERKVLRTFVLFFALFIVRPKASLASRLYVRQVFMEILKVGRAQMKCLGAFVVAASKDVCQKHFKLNRQILSTAPYLRSSQSRT